MHPRLTVVPLEGGDHEPVRSAVRGWARTVDTDALDAAIADAAERRRARDREVLERLEGEIQELGRRQMDAESRLHQLLDRQQQALDDATWCRAQPAQDAREHDEIAAAGPPVEEQRRRVREANSRLERVLEQRAAADAALEEARRELGDLGAVTFDETGVRRRMEEASRELADASDAHRAKLAELEASRRHVADIEAQVAADDDAASTDAEPDQFRVLHASIRASLRTEPIVTADEVEAARSRMEALEAELHEIAATMTVARQRVQGLESELAARTRDGHSLGARQDAAQQLEQQVLAVEQRLGEAEQQARADVDEATRALSRLELTVERLYAAAADRRRRLRELAGNLPAEAQDVAMADPLAAAERIADALGAVATELQPAIERTGSAIEADRHELNRRREEFEGRQAGLHEVQAEDRAEAVDHLFSTDAPVAVDLLAGDDHPTLTLADLDADFTGPVVVLTDVVDVVSWAIGIPADRGAVVPVQALVDATPDRLPPIDPNAPNTDMEQHTS